MSFFKDGSHPIRPLIRRSDGDHNPMYELSLLIAPSLRTLTLAWGIDYYALRWFGREFPVLEELTVWGSVDCILQHSHGFRPTSDDRPPWYHSPSLPSLQRFHFICESAHERIALFAPWKTWISASPITHLRLSDINVDDSETGFVETLANALGVPVPPHWSVQAEDSGNRPIVRNPDTVFPHLRYLWIHVDELVWPSDYVQGIWLVLRCKLHELVQSVERVEGMRAVFMKSSLKKKIWEQRLWEDWVGRIEGRRGCWVESAEEEAQLEETQLEKMQLEQMQLEGPDNPAREWTTAVLDW